MAVIAFGSAKGAPGVTTTVLALAMRWPRPVVVVEADLAGPSVLAGMFRGQLPHDRGLGNLVLAHSHGDLESEIWDQVVPLLENDADRVLLPGLPGPHAAPSALDLWTPLAQRLSSLERDGADALVDLGRIRAEREDREIIVRLADQVVLVTRSRLPDVAVAHDFVRATIGDDPAMRDLTNYCLLTIAAGEPYQATEIARVLHLESAGEIPWDPGSAEVLSVGAKTPRSFDRSPLMRASSALAGTLLKRVATRRERVGMNS